jgi:hypothetical protein
VTDLEFLVEMVRSVVDDPEAACYTPRRNRVKAEIQAARNEAQRLAQMEREAQAVMAWAAPWAQS